MNGWSKGAQQKLLGSLLAGASDSPAKLFLLNRVLQATIPFNRPHGVTIVAITPEEVLARLPFTRRNKNHLGGLHACALAALGEFASGILVLNNLGFGRYRLIMSELKAEYHYQGKTEAYARTSLPKEHLEEQIKRPLENADHVTYVGRTEVVDREQNMLCTVSALWHIKEWSKTRNV